MRYLTRSLLLSLCALTMGACQPLPPQSAAPEGQERSAATPEYHKMGYKIRWVRDIEVPRDRQIVERVILGDLVMTVQYPGNVISAIGLADGSARWQNKFVTSSERLCEPFRRKDEIFVNTDHHMYRLTADAGRFEERTDLNMVVTAAPGLMGDTMVFGTISGKVYGLNIESCGEVWAYGMSMAVLTRPIPVGGGIFVADANGVYALISSTGDVLFRQRAFDRISAQPAYSPQTALIYVASEDMALYAISRATGVPRWTYPTSEPLTVAPILTGNTVFLTLPVAKKVVAIDALSGKELWTYKGVMTPISLAGQNILAYDDSSLLTLDAATGAVIRKVPTRQSLVSVLSGPDGSLVMVAADGRITRLDPTR